MSIREAYKNGLEAGAITRLLLEVSLLVSYDVLPLVKPSATDRFRERRDQLEKPRGLLEKAVYGLGFRWGEFVTVEKGMSDYIRVPSTTQ